MALTVLDLTHVDGTENPSGMSQQHGFALLSDLVTIENVKKLTDVAATDTNIARIDNAHTFAAGKKMGRVYATEDTGEVTVL